MRRRRAQRLGFMALAVLASGHLPAAAQEEAGTTTEAPTPTQAAPGEERTEMEPQADERRSSEVFLPSEEISEDYAVPFPVDI